MIKLAEQKVFREKSLERISSPEQLTDYLKVTNPGIWTLLAAVVILIGGLFAWSTVGELETLADGTAIVSDGTAQIKLADGRNEVKSGMAVRFGEEEYYISSVQKDEFGAVYAYAPVSEVNGVYDVKVVTEKIHPISFLLN